MIEIVFKKNKKGQNTIFHLRKDGIILCGVDKRFPAIYSDRYGTLEDNKDALICLKCKKSKQ